MYEVEHHILMYQIQCQWQIKANDRWCGATATVYNFFLAFDRDTAIPATY